MTALLLVLLAHTPKDLDLVSAPSKTAPLQMAYEAEPNELALIESQIAAKHESAHSHTVVYLALWTSPAVDRN